MTADRVTDEIRPGGDAPAARRTGFVQIWACAAARVAEARGSDGQVYSEGLVADEADTEAHNTPKDVLSGQ